MSEKTCGTCEHFYDDHDRDEWRAMPNGRGWCDKIEDACYIDDKDDSKPAIMVTRASSGLAVLPSFGCILHEPKRSPDDPAGD